MSANSFVNGFMGGMNAMNGMLDSKARREEAAWRKEMYLEDREIAAQERARQEQDRQRMGNIRQLNATMHSWQNMKPDARKQASQSYIDQLNKDPAFRAALDNNNPNEVAELADLTWAKDADGNPMIVPNLNIYDIKDTQRKKVLRTGKLSDRRQDGGKTIGMPMQDFVNFAASQSGQDPLIAMQSKMISLGGEIPEAATRFGPMTTSMGLTGQYNQGTNEFMVKGSKSGTGTGGVPGVSAGNNDLSGSYKKISDRTIVDEDTGVETYYEQRQLDDGRVYVFEQVVGSNDYRTYLMNNLENPLDAGKPKGGLDTVLPVTDTTAAAAVDPNAKPDPTPKPEPTPEPEPTPVVNKSNAAKVLAANPGMVDAIAQQEAVSQNAHRAAEDISKRLGVGWDLTADFLKKRGKAAGTEYRGGMNDA